MPVTKVTATSVAPNIDTSNTANTDKQSCVLYSGSRFSDASSANKKDSPTTNNDTQTLSIQQFHTQLLTSPQSISTHQISSYIYHSLNLSDILTLQDSMKHSYQLIDITQKEFSSELLHSLLSISPTPISHFQSKFLNFKKNNNFRLDGCCYGFVIETLKHLTGSLHFNSIIPLQHFLSTLSDQSTLSLSDINSLFHNIVKSQDDISILTSDQLQEIPIYIEKTNTYNLLTLLSQHSNNIYIIRMNGHAFLFYFHQGNLSIININSTTFPLNKPIAEATDTWLKSGLVSSDITHIIGELLIYPLITSNENDSILMPKLQQLFINTCQSHNEIVFDNNNKTLLHWIVISSHKNSYHIPFLLTTYLHSIPQKINLNALSNKGWSIGMLLHRYSTNIIPILSILLDYDSEKRVNFNITDNHGWNSLMILFRYVQEPLNCLRLMLNHDSSQSIDFNAINDNNFTALIFSAIYSNDQEIEEIFEEIFRHNPSEKINLNIQNNTGLNVLMVLLRKNRSKRLIKMVLNYSSTIDLTAKSKKGNTALMIAKEYYADQEIIDLLTTMEAQQLADIAEKNLLLKELLFFEDEMDTNMNTDRDIIIPIAS